MTRSRASAKAAGSRVERLILPIATPPLTLNQRHHWAMKAKVTADLRLMGKMVGRLWLRDHQPLERAIVALHYRPRDRRTRDSLNIAPTLKPITDGLVDVGVLTRGDGAEWVREECRIHSAETGQPAECWITIEPWGQV